MALDLDLDLGSGHTAYRHASVIDLYLHFKFHWNRRNFLCMDGRTYVRMGWADGHLRPALLGRLGRVNLKILILLFVNFRYSCITLGYCWCWDDRLIGVTRRSMFARSSIQLRWRANVVGSGWPLFNRLCRGDGGADMQNAWRPIGQANETKDASTRLSVLLPADVADVGERRTERRLPSAEIRRYNTIYAIKKQPA